jgi:hypothetical protein
MGTGCSTPVATEPTFTDSSQHASSPQGENLDPTTRSAVAIQPADVTAKSADDVVNSIGVNVHLSYFRTPYGTGWESIIKPKLTALGVRHLRDAGTVTSSDGWMQTVYGRMKELSDRGMKFDLIMKPADGVNDYSQLTQFDRLMQFAAPVVESFEGLNEHDLSGHPNWVAEVRSFQNALYQKVKNDPRTAKIPVYGPSIGHPENASQVGDLSKVMDFGSIHPYPGGLQPLNNLADHEDKVKGITGTRALMVTETGYHTALAWTGGHPPVSESAMARYVLRLVLEFYDAGIPRSFLYEFIDQGTDQTQREQNFGLLHSNGTEKPAFTALKNFIGTLADPGPTFSAGKLSYALGGDTTGVRQMLLQKRDGRFYLVLWQASSSFDIVKRLNLANQDKAVTVQLGQPAGNVKVYMPLTSAEPIRQLQGASSVSVAVPDNPVILELSR